MPYSSFHLKTSKGFKKALMSQGLQTLCELGWYYYHH